MKQLSGLDAAFLAAESEHLPTHVSLLLLLDKPTADHEPFPAWRRQLAERLHLLEPLRRRLVEVPLGLDHPYWIADPAFDLDFHVRHSAVPPPGTDAQLDALVGRLIAGPMDRDHPLWVSHVIEGLAPADDGTERFAILTMIHHAAVDGAAAAMLFTRLLEDDPDADPPSEATEWSPEPPPATEALLARAALHGVARPARGLLLTARAGQYVARATRNDAVIDLADRLRGSLRGPLGRALNVGRHRDADRDPPPLPPVPAPPTPFNAPVSRYRRFVSRVVPLDDVTTIGRGSGATVNDTVVAICAGGLRRWLSGRDALPDQPLSALIPVSLRTGDEPDPWSNRVSGMISSLPTDVDDPRARLDAAHDALDTAKALFSATPTPIHPDLIGLPTPNLFAGGAALSRITTRWMTSGLPFNLIISNVPGPRDPLYMGGARARHYYPVSAIADGLGLNITVQSYDGALDVGLVACAELMPDLADLADALVDEFALLRDRTSS